MALSKRSLKIIGIVGGVVLTASVLASTIGRDGDSDGMRIGQLNLSTDDGIATVYFTEDVFDEGARFEVTAKPLVVGTPEGFSLVGNYVYDITCSTTTFSESIVICLPIPEGIKPELAYAIVSLDNDNWTYIGGSLDRSQDMIMARVNHLSDFAVVSAEESTEPSECSTYDTLECQNAVADFEFENENASVFSLPCPLGEVDLESVIVSQTCGTVLSYSLGGSVVPGIGTVVGAIGGWIAVNLEKLNPVRIAPLTEDVIALSDGQIEGSGLLDPDTVSAIIFLDFIGTDRDLDYVQRLKKLEVHVSDSIGIAFHETHPLLSKAEMRSLDPCKSYIVFPKKPFDIPDKAKELGEIYLEAIVYWELSWTHHLQDSHAQSMRIELDEVSTPTPEEEPPDEFNLTISSTEGGSVTRNIAFVWLDPKYETGIDVVNLVAKAEEGYQFVEWTGDTGTIDAVDDATTTITVDGDYVIMANFEKSDTTSEPEQEETECGLFFGPEFEYIARMEYVFPTSDQGYLVITGHNHAPNTAWGITKFDNEGNELWFYEQMGSGGSLSFFGVTELENNQYFGGFLLSETYWITLDKNGNEVSKETGPRSDTYPLLSDHDQCLTSDGYAVSPEVIMHGNWDPAEWDLRLIKTNEQRETVWRRTVLRAPYSNWQGIEINMIRQVSDGGYVLVGHVEDPLYRSKEVLLIKTDAEGNMEWNHIYENEESERHEPLSFTERHGGGYMIVGHTRQITRRDPSGSIGVGHMKPLLIVTDKLGNLVLERTYTESFRRNDAYSEPVFISIQRAYPDGYMVFGEDDGLWGGHFFIAKIDDSGNCYSEFG